MSPPFATQSSGGVWPAAGREEVGEEAKHELLFSECVLLKPGLYCTSTKRAHANIWHDPISSPCHLSVESESELSVSGFLSVASLSNEEDEGRDAPLLNSLSHPSAHGGAAGMSGEGNQGNRPAQHNGVKKHRWDMLHF